ncbi:MAG: carotenoid biosynthesis protein [Ilumatobacteraceae bacterium]
MRRSSLVLVSPVAVSVAAMVAYPLAAPGGRARRHLTTFVVGGLWATTTVATGRRWGAIRAVAAAGVLGLATAAVERVGSVTGVPFGRYRYTDRLRPQVAGVPIIVPLAWWAMAVPAREVAVATLGGRSNPATRIALGAVGLTAWDLFLDPQMTAEGYWRWARPGGYRGIPFGNFLGWLVTAAAVMAALEVLVPARRADAVLVGEYAVMGVMETVGFSVFFRDRIVAAVGGLAMLPLAALGVAGLGRQRGG